MFAQMIYICFVFGGQQTVWWPLQSLDTHAYVVVVLPAVAVVVSVELFFFCWYCRCHYCRLCCICSCPCSSPPSSCYCRGCCVALPPVFGTSLSFQRESLIIAVVVSVWHFVLLYFVCWRCQFVCFFGGFLFSFLFKILFVRQNETVVVVIVVL